MPTLLGKTGQSNTYTSWAILSISCCDVGIYLHTFYVRTFIVWQVWNIIGWALSAGGCLAVLYTPYSANMGYHAVSITESMAYGGLTRTVWSLGIAFLIISCHLGQGGKSERIITDYRVLFRKERSSYLCSLSTVTMSDGFLSRLSSWELHQCH